MVPVIDGSLGEDVHQGVNALSGAEKLLDKGGKTLHMAKDIQKSVMVDRRRPIEEDEQDEECERY